MHCNRTPQAIGLTRWALAIGVLVAVSNCTSNSIEHSDSGDSDTPPGTAAFGEPCGAASDCASTLCIDSGGGAFCTRDCTGGCPQGWQCKSNGGSSGGSSAGVCVPALNNLCVPCTRDEQCGPVADACITIGLGTYCGCDCSAEACPDGYTCSAVDHGGATVQQCMPTSGTCDCQPVNEGLTRGCSNRNADGTCYGTATCDPAVGWVDCSAAAAAREECNGVDDDCDGFVDDDDWSVAYPGGSRICPYLTGCEGENVCTTDAGGAYVWQCRYDLPLIEQCDGRDNDCNGVVDDPFATTLAGGALLYDKTDANCGGCGNDCSRLVPRATATRCVSDGASAHCEATACAPGAYLGADHQCWPLVWSKCNACQADADCIVPGSKCLTVGEGKFCGQDCSAASPFSGVPTACTGAVGTSDCCGAGYTCQQVGPDKQCLPSSGTCWCEAASLGVVRQCSVTNGTATCRGLQSCAAAAGGYAWTPCGVDPTVVELCNGIDDDCDTQIDEDFKNTSGPGLGYDTDEHCGQCFNDCLHRWDFNTHHAAGACNTATSPYTCEMVCATETGWVDANGDPDDGCECLRTSSRDDPDTEFDGYPDSTSVYHDSNCDGIDGVIGQALYVWGGNTGTADGSLAHPFKTIGAAITAFPTSGKKYILVAAGIYEEQVVITNGIQMHGGYSDDFRTRDIVLFPTVIAAREPASYAAGYKPGSLNITCNNWDQPTIVSGFFVYGYDVSTAAAAAGYTSYAVYMKDCNEQVQLLNSAVIGGRGGPGADGANGVRGWGAGDTGAAVLNGLAGRDADDAALTPTTGGSRHNNGGGAGGTYDPNFNRCTSLFAATTALVPGGEPGHNTQPGCENSGQRGGGADCPHTYNDPDFAGNPPAASELHVGFQAEYKYCTQTIPDCCPYAVLPNPGTGEGNPRSPATWPACTSTPYRCIVPQGSTQGVCAAKQTCTLTSDCPPRYLCQGSGTKYCELPATCSVNEDCPSGFACGAGKTCVPGAYGGNGPGAFDSTMNVVVVGCNQVTESGFPAQIDLTNGAGSGANGATGHSGLGGPGCADATGAMTDMSPSPPRPGEWIGLASAQATGGTGQPGQPGGGGGGGAGIAYHDVGNNGPTGNECLRYEIAVSGGGGGAGGCGGTGGGAGQAGGGSVALFVSFATTPAAGHLPLVRDNRIARGFGGTGGRGGAAADGGFGGAGGAGKSEDMAWGFVYSSGAGGAGGRGGAGGGGGGGCGGGSYGLLLWNVASASLTAENEYETLGSTGGQGGAGGASPDASKAGGAGTLGASRDVAIFCGPANQCPTGTTCQNRLCLP